MSLPDWRVLAKRAADLVGTPCYLMAESTVRGNLDKLMSLETAVPLRHWVSMKSQPVAKLARMACDAGLGIDVVSEYELLAARDVGFPNSRILVNGVGKHQWMPRHRLEDLVVHFDSQTEVAAMAGLARDLKWRVGLRCAIPVAGAYQPGRVQMRWDQFGMSPEELQSAVGMLKQAGVGVSGLHFHLHTVPRRVGDYRDAVEHLAQMVEKLELEPEYIDVGGGIPVEREWTRDGLALASQFDMEELRGMLGRVPLALPSIREIWMENGRYLSGPAGALVVTVLEKKERDSVNFLICDGGRVNHARMAASEVHELLLLPLQGGPYKSTVVCGPTCGAVDRLGGWDLPESIRPGDRVIWGGAGAYHIPLETRFSTGFAPVVWFDMKGEPEVIRDRESAQEWWSQWKAPVRLPLVAAG